MPVADDAGDRWGVAAALSLLMWLHVAMCGLRCELS